VSAETGLTIEELRTFEQLLRKVKRAALLSSSKAAEARLKAAAARADRSQRNLTNKRIGALVVIRYLRPGISPGEAASPWWECKCARCGATQEHQAVRLRNKPPTCRACGMAS
jgi:hypothetical protein